MPATLYRLFSFFFSLLLITAAAHAQDSVQIYEKPFQIPTYLVGEPEVNPIFYTGKAYQGAQGRVYPYALHEKLTDKLENRTYTGLFLENEYVQICVLPELGGKWYIARDKSNDYDFIYHNRVIKPALIGMLGSWTSGGVEWNIPHHHRATSDLPVDYVLRENPDGSKTIWIGETERRHRTRWAVALTLHPGRSNVEVDLYHLNQAPVANSLLMWANTAVHANENYQVIFPPSTQYATFHAKNEFTEWPISHQVYRGVDYTSGVDVSWWKSHPDGVSFFAWNYEDDFVAGYDHGQEAGIAIVANHHVAPGKKLWNWGTGPHAQLWYDLLSDDDGPYLEIMTGAFTDNQPDYSWSDPYAGKHAQMIFYPLKKSGAIENANENGAVSLDVLEGNRVHVAFNTTSAHTDATVLLLNGNEVVEKRVITIDPAHPYEAEIKLPENVSAEKVRTALVTAESDTLVAYQPVDREKQPMPEEVRPPEPPEEIASVEELYLVGLRLDQFHNPSYSPYPYFEEALRRDPENALVNTHLGILYLKRGMFEKAEDHFRTAVARVTRRYTTPRDAESLYYLGVVLWYQGRYDEAYDYLYRATWDHAWHSPAHYLMAQISSRKGDYERALAHVEEALAANMRNHNAAHLKAVLLRKLGRKEAVQPILDRVIERDPLFFPVLFERSLADPGARESLVRRMRGEVQNYLELAVTYGNAGFYDDALSVLSLASRSEAETVRNYPMVYYFLGYYSEQNGDREGAASYYRQAGQLPTDFCFPYRVEEKRALEAALARIADDARAWLYLGNYYYDNEPEMAMQKWEKARELDPTLAIVHRNLAFGYAYAEHDYARAAESMEQALTYNTTDPRLFYEADLYAEWAARPPEERLNRLKTHHDVARENDGALAREVALLVLHREYDRAIDILSAHHFRRAEGAGGIHDLWVDAHLLRGMEALHEGQAARALEDFRGALRYPKNLEVARSSREAQVHYFIGLANEKLGNTSEARAAFTKTVEAGRLRMELRWYRAQALVKLGRPEEAAEIFDSLIASGKRELESGDTPDFFAKFGQDTFENGRLAEGHYLIGLGQLGKGDAAAAKMSFERALELNPAHSGAAVQLRYL